MLIAAPEFHQRSAFLDFKDSLPGSVELQPGTLTSIQDDLYVLGRNSSSSASFGSEPVANQPVFMICQNIRRWFLIGPFAVSVVGHSEPWYREALLGWVQANCPSETGITSGLKKCVISIALNFVLLTRRMMLTRQCGRENVFAQLELVGQKTMSRGRPRHERSQALLCGGQPSILARKTLE